MRIAYVGKKDLQVDVIGGGAAWTPGEVREIESHEVCKALLVHTDSWALAQSVELLSDKDKESPAEVADFARQQVSSMGLIKAPEAMEPAELRTHCTARGWVGHPQTGKPKLLAWLQEQAK